MGDAIPNPFADCPPVWTVVELDNYVLRWRLTSDYAAAFQVFAVLGKEVPMGRLLFAKLGEDHDYVGLDDLDNAACEMQGQIKWDGCTDIDYPSAEKVMDHFCGRKSLLEWGALFGRVYDEVAPKIPQYDREVADHG